MRRKAVPSLYQLTVSGKTYVGVSELCQCNINVCLFDFSEIFVSWSTYIHRRQSKSWNCQEDGGVGLEARGASPWPLFIERGICWIFTRGITGGITEVLCLIFLQFIGFSLKKSFISIGNWSISTDD